MTDMHKIVDSFLKYIREVPVHFLFALTAISGLALFLPEHLAKIVALDEFRAEYRVFIGPAFWLAFFLLAGRLFSFWRRQHRQKQALKKAQKSLHQLNPEERGHLAVYVLEKQTILYASIEDQIMRGLAMKGITRSPSQHGFLLDGIAYTLQPWAEEYLEKNPHLLDGSTISPDFVQRNQHILNLNHDSHRIGG